MMRLLTILINCRWSACRCTTVISSLCCCWEGKGLNLWGEKQRTVMETPDPDAGLVILVIIIISTISTAVIIKSSILLIKNYSLHVQMQMKVRPTRTLPLFTQIFNVRISPGCKHCRQHCRGGRCDCFRRILLPFPLFQFYTAPPPHTPLPQDLLVHYTRALLFNMSWKQTWVSSITHFLLCTLFLCNAAVCMRVTFRKKKRNYSLVASFCLTPDPLAQQLGGKCRIAN